MKYILVTGDALSGIRKNIIAGSIGALLKACYFNVTAIKIDPNINIDSRYTSPREHGEAFVLNDGSKVDSSLGNYESFLDIDLSSINILTTGKIYQQVIDWERDGGYGGEPIRVVPYITDAIQKWIEEAAEIQHGGEEADVCIIELGGTIGLMETMPFVEALRRLRRRVAHKNFCCVHVASVPRDSEECGIKLGLASFSSSNLGVHPDIIVCESETPLSTTVKNDIFYLYDIKQANIFTLPPIKHIYEVPIKLHDQRMIESISLSLNIHARTCDQFEKWKNLCSIAVNAKEQIIIALVGDHSNIYQAYASVMRALEHACNHINVRPDVRFIDSTLLDNEDSPAWGQVKTSHCMIVPDGPMHRGLDGKIQAIKFARGRYIPFLGIGLGFQLAAFVHAKDTLVSLRPDSELLKRMRFSTLVIKMPDHEYPENKVGGTKRLGLRKTLLSGEDSCVRQKYGNESVIEERNRTRYEIDPKCVSEIETSSFKFVGKSEDGTRMDILEWDQSAHPYFVGVQFQPEYRSRPFKPSPLYLGLIEAAKIRAKNGILY